MWNFTTIIIHKKHTRHHLGVLMYKKRLNPVDSAPVYQRLPFYLAELFNNSKISPVTLQAGLPYKMLSLPAVLKI
jgi:hypothetical protein